MKRSKTRHNVLELVMIAYAAIGVLCILIAALLYFAKNNSGKAEKVSSTEIITEDQDFSDGVEGDTPDTDADAAADTDTAVTEDSTEDEVSDDADTDDESLVDADVNVSIDESSLDEDVEVVEEDTDEVLDDAQDFLDESTDTDDAVEDETGTADTAGTTFTVKRELSRNVVVRSEPDVNSSKVGNLKPGDTGTVEQEGDEWTLIESGGLTGYIRNDLILIGDVD